MWKEPGLSAGGMQIDGNAVGGAAKNQGMFVPASIIWDTGVEGTGVSWMTVSVASFLKGLISNLSSPLAVPNFLVDFSYRNVLEHHHHIPALCLFPWK